MLLCVCVCGGFFVTEGAGHKDAHGRWDSTALVLPLFEKPWLMVLFLFPFNSFFCSFSMDLLFLFSLSFPDQFIPRSFILSFIHSVYVSPFLFFSLMFNLAEILKIEIFVLFLGSKVKAFPWTGPRWQETPLQGGRPTWLPMRYDIAVCTIRRYFSIGSENWEIIYKKNNKSSVYRVLQETPADFLCRCRVPDRLWTSNAVGSECQGHVRGSPTPPVHYFLHTLILYNILTSASEFSSFIAYLF